MKVFGIGWKWVLSIIVLLSSCAYLVVSFVLIPTIPTFTKHEEGSSVFFRLKSAYMHGDERIEFDIVVGCAVLVTSYRDNSTSYAAFRDPVSFTTVTRDGAALMQLTPDACGGQTTANGEVPADFLPGAIWFADSKDLSLGIGYLSEDAYDNPESALKFLSSTVEPATRQDWLSFKSTAERNLIDPEIFVHTQPWPSEREVRAHMWDRAKLAEWTRGTMECHGYSRHHIEGPDAPGFLGQFRPLGAPRFWVPREEDVPKIGGYFIDPNERNIRGRLDGHFMLDFEAGPNQQLGFPTRAQGGMIASKHFHRRASALFPMKADDGVHWANPDLQLEDAAIRRDIDFAGGKNLGFTYCYSNYQGFGPVGALHLPGYSHRYKPMLIDGNAVAPDATSKLPGAIPDWIFDGTEYIFIKFSQRVI